MTKSEWGVKRTCANCDERFYDLNRRPVVCPQCGSAVNSGSPAEAEPDQVPKPEPDGKTNPAGGRGDLQVIEELEKDDGEIRLIDDAEGAEGLIEDASDLGQDDDDVSEVMEHVDEGVEDKN